MTSFPTGYFSCEATEYEGVVRAVTVGGSAAVITVVTMEAAVDVVVVAAAGPVPG